MSSNTTFASGGLTLVVNTGLPGPRGNAGPVGPAGAPGELLAGLAVTRETDTRIKFTLQGADGLSRWGYLDLLSGVSDPPIPSAQDIAQYQVSGSSTAWVGIPYGTRQWVEATVPGSPTLTEVFDCTVPPGTAPPGGWPCVAYWHPNGETRTITPGSALDTKLRQVALSSGFAFLSPEFLHPVANKNFDGQNSVPHDGAARALQGMRAHAQALGLNPNEMYIVVRSRGNIAMWQALQANAANPSAPTHAGRQSTLVSAIYSINGQPTFRSLRFAELFVQPADHAALLAANPDDPRMGSAYLSVATAPQVPPLVMLHDTPYFNRLIALSELPSDNGVHFPDGGKVMEAAYAAAGFADRCIIADNVTGGDDTYAAAVPFFAALRSGAVPTEAMAIATSARRTHGLYYPRDGSGLYANADGTGAVSIGGTVGTVIDGRFGLANRALGPAALGFAAGQNGSNRRPTLQTGGAPGQLVLRFDNVNDLLAALVPNTGTPALRAWAGSSEVSTIATSTTTAVQFGFPALGGRDLSLAVVSAEPFSDLDLKIYRQFATVLSGVSY